MTSNEKTLNINGEASRPPETMTTLAWKRFRRHPGAVAGAIVLTILILAAVFAPLSPYDPEKSDIKNKNQPPSLVHPFGTDGLGRDLLTRSLYGGRVSLSVGLMVVGITLSIGVPIGSIAGYYGGWIDNVLMRIIDATLSIPSLMFLILLAAILRETDLPFVKSNSVMTIAVVIGVLSWPTVARLVRAVFLNRPRDGIRQGCPGIGSLCPQDNTERNPAKWFWPHYRRIYIGCWICHHGRIGALIFRIWDHAAYAELGQYAQQRASSFNHVPLDGDFPRFDDFPNHYFSELYWRWNARCIGPL